MKICWSLKNFSIDFNGYKCDVLWDVSLELWKLWMIKVIAIDPDRAEHFDVWTEFLRCWMWEEKRAKLIGWNNNKNFVRSITYSWNAVSAFPLNNLLTSSQPNLTHITISDRNQTQSWPITFSYIFLVSKSKNCYESCGVFFWNGKKKHLHDRMFDNCSSSLQF